MTGQYLVMIFFFSSRRRHTRYWRDWSSDVCSSDLGGGPARVPRLCRGRLAEADRPGAERRGRRRPPLRHLVAEIGRASCRGKSVDLGGRRLIKKKKKQSTRARSLREYSVHREYGAG